MYGISAFICPRGFFLSKDFLFEKLIKQVTMDLLYIRFTFFIKDNHQECISLRKWLFLSCLGPWMNDLLYDAPRLGSYFLYDR